MSIINTQTVILELVLPVRLAEEDAELISSRLRAQIVFGNQLGLAAETILLLNKTVVRSKIESELDLYFIETLTVLLETYLQGAQHYLELFEYRSVRGTLYRAWWGWS